MVCPMSDTELQISAMAHGGAGVGREQLPGDETSGASGRAWFVPGALPGERVTAAIDHQAKRFVRGRLVSVLQPAEIRVDPPCALAGTCGGCAWQHVAVDSQAELKRRIVVDQLRKLVPEDRVVAHASSPRPQAHGYRRRARLHYERDDDGTLRLGFFAPHSRDLVDVPHCPVLVPALDHAFARLRTEPSLLLRRGEVHGLTDGTEVALALPGVKPSPERIAAAQRLIDGPLVGVLLRGGRAVHAVGRTKVAIDGRDGLPPVKLSPLSFAQASEEGNRALVRHVLGRAKVDGLRVLELFCGAGNFTRALARTALRVWALDGDREAIAALRQLAEAHGLPINAKRGTAEGVLAKHEERGTGYDVVVLDPPRRGLGQAASSSLARVAGERIVYVSCDPATLARDLEVLTTKGWAIDDITTFDLMPMTPEVETVVTLTRKGKG